MTIIEIATPIIGVITTGIATVFSFRAGRRKSNAEARSAELQNVEDAIKIWRDMAQAMAQETKEITQRSAEDYQRLYSQNVELLNQNKELMKKITNLEKEMEIMKKTV